MSSFISTILTMVSVIFSWCRQCAALIRTTPFLLFTIGFIALVYAIVVFGRMLGNE